MYKLHGSYPFHITIHMVQVITNNPFWTSSCVAQYKYHRGVFSISRLNGDRSPDFFLGGASVMVVFCLLWMVMLRLLTSSWIEDNTVTTVERAFWFSDITCKETRNQCTHTQCRFWKTQEIYFILIRSNSGKYTATHPANMVDIVFSFLVVLGGRLYVL